MSSPCVTWRPKQIIRPLSIGLIWRQRDLLLSRVFDDDGRTIGWRPLGGAIEFGETARDALKREFLEELGEEVTEPELVTVMENLYEHHGVNGHEIVFVFGTSFVRQDCYEIERFAYKEESLDGLAEWLPFESLAKERTNLFPDGLLQRLEPPAA